MAKILTVRILVNEEDAEAARIMIEHALHEQMNVVDFVIDEVGDASSDTNECLAEGTYVRSAAFRNDDYVIFSASEAREAEGAGFWSNEFGWTTMDLATKFESTKGWGLPMSRGGDATWMVCPYDLTFYTVLLVEEGQAQPIAFECFAEGAHHASEQARDAYPGCTIESVGTDNLQEQA